MGWGSSDGSTGSLTADLYYIQEGNNPNAHIISICYSSPMEPPTRTSAEIEQNTRSIIIATTII